MGRELGADATSRGYDYAGNILNQAQDFMGQAGQYGKNLMGGAQGALDKASQYGQNLMGQADQFMGQMGDVEGAANYYLQKGTNALGMYPGAISTAQQGLGQYQNVIGGLSGDLGTARGVLGDISNPTAYNSLYQSAEGRQRNTIDSQLAARGLASSGPGLQAEAASNLSDQFGMRQRQEQIQALGAVNAAGGTLAGAEQGYNNAAQGMGGMIQGYGNLAGNLAQMPSSIYSQLGSMYPGMAGLGANVGNMYQQFAGVPGQIGQMYPGMAGMAGIPQSVVGTGMDIYRTGTSMPLETMQDVYNIARAPQLAGGQILASQQ
jgi:hypothetical protein